MFLLLEHFSKVGITLKEQKLVEAMELLERMQLPNPEELAKVLVRCGPAGPRRKVFRQPRVMGRPKAACKWPAKHAAFQVQHGLTKEDVEDGKAEFQAEVGQRLSERAADAFWLWLVKAKKESNTVWKEHALLVAPVGNSINWMGLRRWTFACVQPNQTYAALQHGKVSVVGAAVLLALQGIQTPELSAFRFEEDMRKSPKLLQDLAGNAFTANVLAGFLVAGLLAL